MRGCLAGLRLCFAVLRVTAAGLAAATASSAADLRIVGTDLLGVEFTKAFYAFAGREGFGVTLAFDGSRPGLEQLRAGRADLGLLVLPAEQMRTLAGFETLPIGYHAVVVAAPAACPLDQITFAQLAAVFGAGAGVGNTPGVRWGDLGVQGEWAGELVTPLAPEVGTGLALEYFRHAVLRDAPLRRDLQRFATVAELSAHLRSQPRALVIMAAPPAAGMKPLKVAVSADQPAVPATPETLHAGSYALRLPVQLVFPTDRLREATRTVEFLHGDDAAILLERAGVVPLPPSARAAQPGQKKKPSN